MMAYVGQVDRDTRPSVARFNLEGIPGVDDCELVGLGVRIRWLLGGCSVGLVWR